MVVNEQIPKSRITLTYRTAVHGELEDVKLPFRLLLMGDLSMGTSQDRKLDLDQREIRNLDGTNLDQLMADMGMSIDLSVPNRIDPQNTEEIAFKLPLTSMKSFSPNNVAEQMPKVRALLLLRKLLLEVQANLDNRKEFRRNLRVLAQNEAVFNNLMKELEKYEKESFEVPERVPPASNEDGGANLSPGGTPPAGSTTSPGTSDPSTPTTPTEGS